MIISTKIVRIALIAAIALIVGTTPAGVIAKGSERPSGGRAVTHADGKKVAAPGPALAETFSVGGHALEPTLGITPAGEIFYAAAGFDTDAVVTELPGTQILRSDNGGRTWTNTSPRALGQNTMPVTLDPYVYVDDRLDGDTARIFTIDLTLACSYMSYSDDDGESWVTNPLACGRPVNDHQTLFTGPPVDSTTVGYPNIVYYCWNDVGSSACSKSLDGGITFHPTGAPAYAGYEPGSSDPGFFGQDGFCGGLHGHGHVANDGTLYLPREYCGKPTLAVSHDEGTTWEVVEVSKIRSISQPREGAGHPSVTTDKKGNVYYMWVGAKDRLPYMSVSRDEGQTWSKPTMVGAPGLKETNLPQIDALGTGKVALVYYGSMNSRFPKCKQECEDKDYLKTTWNAYLGVSANALSARPLFYTGAVAHPSDPLVRGRCGPGRCHWPYDFIDVEIGPDGIAYGAFVDGCMPATSPDEPGCTDVTPREGDYEGLVTRVIGAPSLL